MRHKLLFSKFHRITDWQKSLRHPKIRPIHAIFKLFESDTQFFSWIKKNLFMALELKFHVRNNPNWSNFLIIYGFHGFPLHRFDRFNAVHYLVALTGFMWYLICRVVLKKVDVIYICFLLFYHIELYINKILSSCTFIIYRIKGFHSDHIYTGWP